MHEKFIPRQELLDRLEIGYPLFRKLRNEGGPDPEGTGKAARWPLYAWCQWITSRQANGTFNQALALRAAAILRERDGIPAVIEPEVLSPEPGTEEPGLEHALARLRQAETILHSRWLEAVQAGNASAPVFFKEWQVAVDLLRKAEKNLTDHLTQTRDLLPAHEVKEWMTRQLTAARASLLNIPGKLAPQLEGQPWPKIQRKLEEEIRFALEKISNQPE